MKGAGTESHALAVNYIIIIILLVVLYLLWLSLWHKKGAQESCEVGDCLIAFLRLWLMGKGTTGKFAFHLSASMMFS